MRRGGGRFLVEAASHKFKRLHQLKTLRRAAGAWKGKDHPEPKAVAAEWVRTLRRQDEKRFDELSKSRPKKVK